MEQIVSLTEKSTIHNLTFGVVRKGQGSGIPLWLSVSCNLEHIHHSSSLDLKLLQS